MERTPRSSCSWGRRCLRGLLAAIISAMALVTPVQASSGPVVLPDFPIPNGHFYTEASGLGTRFGFAITDDDGARFASEFERLGGVPALGYPASSRFMLGGYLTQATQKALLQWRPALGRADRVNVFDLFTQLGLDPALAATRLIPPTIDNTADTRQPWPRVVARHLAILDRDPVIRARYLADPDPLDDFGLPQGAEDFGGVFVIRCQRAAFQHWRIPTSFARPGDVTAVNAGDLAKEFGVIPPDAITPGPTEDQLVAPPGDPIHLTSREQARSREAAARARPSLVRIDVMLPDGIGIASGIVIDRAGHVLTNAHVIADALLIKITFANGTSLAAHIVGVDPARDLAVVQVPAEAIGPGVSPATTRGSSDLQPGQNLVAMGFTPFFPFSPATRVGIFQHLVPSIPTTVRSDMYILPGDSGGMLLDLDGNVVGVNDEIRFTDQPRQPLISYAIDAADALQVAQRIVQGR